jgi:N-acetylglucosamine-6-phosphate deacetylase
MAGASPVDSPRLAIAQPFAVRGQLLIGGQLVRGAVVVDGETIVEVALESAGPPRGLPARVLDAAIVTAGLIDLQINGGWGYDVGAGADALGALAARLPATGVTAFLPTLVSADPDHYRAAFQALRSFRGRVAGGGRGDGARAAALGLHMEGPFIAAARAGAHDRAAVEAADATLFDEWMAGGELRLVTLAPERPGALPLIRRLRERGVVVSLGHTDASFDHFTRGIDAGATMVTHLFNAMSPFAPRAPGAVGAALTDRRVTAALIADGVHCHPAALALALAAKGAGGLLLVTDATAAAGLGPGTYALGGQTIVSDGRAARLASAAGTLAGSTLTLDEAIRTFGRLTGAPPEQALHMATEVPARLLGLASKGRLAVGCDADLVLWTDALAVEAAFIAGRPARPARTASAGTETS